MTAIKNVLLTGASGTVGFEILHHLCKLLDRFKITVFDLDNKKSRKKLLKFKDKVEVVFGDITQKDNLIEVCKNKDYVIHIAALIPPIADDLPELAYKINAIGTRNLVENLEKYSPNTFFIYSSSISVYGDRLLNPLINVGDDIKASEGDEYAVTKIAAEDIIQNSKLDWTIFRLTAIMGNHKVSKLMFHMPLETSMEICTPRDTGLAFVLALVHQNQLSKRIFNLGGGECCRTLYSDFLIESFNIFGMGGVDFPKKCFAEKNFHCGYYEDGHKLEDILKFRHDSISDYYNHEKKKVSIIQRYITKAISKRIKKRLLNKSEPYQAFIKSDKKMIKRFFNIT
ncbi:MAG TPA: NAD(P)-dependent oxidoreductase [Bacteroidales bacterium]|nr:NAD(P)-dependent oxidoreductase [Bacteroidales bacterium]